MGLSSSARSGRFFGFGVWADHAGRLDNLTAFRELLRLDPTPFAYRLVVYAYIILGRLEEARSAIRQANVNHFDSAAFQ